MDDNIQDTLILVGQSYKLLERSDQMEILLIFIRILAKGVVKYTTYPNGQSLNFKQGAK